jgi:preprotein translocase subunit SecG
MVILLTVVHVLVCLFLIIVVLLQSGKAADLAGAFGGMGSQTAFGPRGSATILSKATTVAAALFMITSLSLSIIATNRSGSAATVLEKVQVEEQKKGGTEEQKGQTSITVTPEGASGGASTVPLPTPPAHQDPKDADKQEKKK